MSEENKQPGINMLELSLRSIYLDPNNFRLIHEDVYIDVPDEEIKDKDVVARTYRLIVGDRYQNIQGLIESFKANGYLPVDQIQVRELAVGGYVVVDGNRRIAALKFLENEYAQKRINLGNLDTGILRKVPIALYENPGEVNYLTFMALKHISGNRKWSEWNQAKLLERLVATHNLTVDDACKRVGISKTELNGSICALALASQYQDSEYGKQFSNAMFLIFQEATKSTELKKWLEWDETTHVANNTNNRDLFFNLLSRAPVNEDNDTESSKKNVEYQEPAILEQNDIHTLIKIIGDSEAVEDLKESRNLDKAYRRSYFFIKKTIIDAESIGSHFYSMEQQSLGVSPGIVNVIGALTGLAAVTISRSNNLQGVEQTSVLSNEIACHFSSVKVIAYRCLNGLEVNNISRINLFAGLNNSGKTSFLEALYLLCKQNDFNGVVDVLRRRGKISEKNIDAKWFGDQLTETIMIEGVFDNKESKIEIKPFIDDETSFNRTNYLKSILISTQFGKYKLKSLTKIHQGQDRETESESIKLLSNIIFSSPFFFNEPYNFTAFFQKSVQVKLLPTIIRFIKEKVVPTIQNIYLVDEFQRFLVDDDIFKNSMDLTSYGEGLQRIFFTSMLFASAKNGVVLIDEFENAIHADLIETFVPFIHSLAKEFNVQVFLTSHSKECIDAFVENIPPDEISDFAFHALVREDNGAIAIREFDGQVYSKLLDAGDVDLRRAR